MQDKNKVQHIYGLTPLQEGLLFHNVTDKNSAAYFVQGAYKLKGKMDHVLVQKSLDLLFARHDILRTAFVYQGLQKAFQVVLADRSIVLHYEDISRLPEKDTYLLSYSKNDRETPFDLTKDVLMRVALFRLEEELFEMVWSHHHILADGWCTTILIGEFNEIYKALQQGTPLVLPPVTQYGEYIKWIDEQDKQTAAHYWSAYLEGYDTPCGLPGSINALAQTTYDNKEVLLLLSDDFHERMTTVAADAEVTMSVLLQCAWGCLLAAYNDRTDLVFGSITALRPASIPHIESMVGLFINTIPVRIKLTPDQPFKELLMQHQERSQESRSYAYYPLAEIQAATYLKEQLIDHVFVLGSKPVSEGIDQLRIATGHTENPVEISDIRSHEQVNYHFSVNISNDGGLRIRFNYNAHVYSENYIHQVAAHYQYLLEQVVADTSIPINKLTLLSTAEKKSLLKMGSGAKRLYSSTLDRLFEAMAAKQPDAVALVATAGDITYHELDNRANEIVRMLQHHDAGKAGKVGVLLPQNTDWIASMIAIFKMGCTYIPLDVNQPAERLAYIIQDTGMDLLITNTSNRILADRFSASMIVVDTPLDSVKQFIIHPQGSERNDTAYIIYTSGTSGLPKGVPVKQESIVDRTLWHNEYLAVDAQEVIIQFAAMTFDASLIEIFMALLAGAKLVFLPEEYKNNISRCVSFLDEKEISIAIFPPAYLKAINRPALPALKKIISTGEAAILEEMLWHAQTRHVYNGYGPTEVCVGATFYKVDNDKKDFYRMQRQIPIGRPFANTTVYIMNKQQQLLPPGVVGEICVGGIGLSTGYLHETVLTKQKFVHTIDASGETGLVVYRTGDLGYWNEYHELEYAGRLDEQVQIRGIRVEPGEIEQVMLQYPGITGAAVCAWQTDHETQLAGYYVSDADITPDELKMKLREKLPYYMIPVYFQKLESLPHMSSGKIDRRQLPKPSISELQNMYVAPATELEEKICRLWEEVLGEYRIGAEADFFQIGGHSIKGIKLISLLEQQLGVAFTLKDLFHYSTIQSQAKFIEALEFVKDNKLTREDKEELESLII